MSPLQLARRDCGNMKPDGSCLGIRPEDLIDRGQVKYATPRAKCLLTESGKRCRYFEKVVLPLAEQSSPPSEPHLQQSRLDARAQYGLCAPPGADLPTMPDRACPTCGRVLAKRQRVCADCQRKRRRDAARDVMRKARGPVNS